MTLDLLLDNSVTIDLQLLFQQGIRQAQRTGRPVVVSVSLPVDNVEAIDLFEQGRRVTPDRYFWSQPGAGFALVGLGVAHAVAIDSPDSGAASRFAQAASAWRQLMAGAIVEGGRDLPGVGPLLLGGFAFDGERAGTALWRGFPPGRLVLPQLLFTKIEKIGENPLNPRHPRWTQRSESWLTYNAVVGPQSDAENELNILAAMREGAFGYARRNGHRGGSSLRSKSPLYKSPPHELRPAADWQADVANAVRAIRAGTLEKVVLARAVELHAEAQPFDAARALRHLAENYTGCYLFAVARGDRCFLGATPERLAQLRAGEVKTVSLAGSIRRGRTPAEDDQLGQALLDSAKDRNEHAVVVQSLVEALRETCATLQVSESPGLIKLGNIQHLCTAITGQLVNGYAIFDLVERLHPTPAVGGRPRAAGLRLIRECEKLDRGWYAGPVGWVNGQGEGEFAVAIRSALLHDHMATLFAGCGIVADSDPEREYAESLLKLKPMLAALNAPWPASL